MQITAQGVMTLKRKTRDDDLAAFQELIEKYEIKKVVAGLPLNMDGSESAQTRKNSELLSIHKETAESRNHLY